MTENELLKEVLQIVGEYRGSNAEEVGYVDKKFGNAIRYIRATNLVECAWHGHIDRVIITERFPEHITTVERAQATFTYSRGQRYVFYRLVQEGTRANLCQLERMRHRRH